MTVTNLEGARYPLAPARTKLNGTLMETATVAPPEGFKWLHDGHDLFQSFANLEFQHFVDMCTPTTKDLSQAAIWRDGFRTFVYGGVTCKAPGMDQEEMASAVSDAFDMGESTGVEMALMAHGFMSGRADDPSTDVVDLTPASGAVRPNIGVALLEGWEAHNYIGAPTLHVPVAVASRLLGVEAGAVRTNTVINTKLGSKLVAGAGYDYPNLGPDGTEPADGEKWIYATGEVLVIPSPEIKSRPLFTPSNNDVVILAERGYYVAVDGPTAAVRVQEIS